MGIRVMVLKTFSAALALGVALMACTGADADDGSAEADEGAFSLRKGEGDTCSYNLQCGGDLVCRPKEVGGRHLACASLGDTDEACDEDDDCVGAGSKKSKTKGRVSCVKGACYRGYGTGGGH